MRSASFFPSFSSLSIPSNPARLEPKGNSSQDDALSARKKKRQLTCSVPWMQQALLIGHPVGEFGCDGDLEILLGSRLVPGLELTREKSGRSSLEGHERGGERAMDAWEEGEGSWGRKGREGGRRKVSFDRSSRFRESIDREIRRLTWGWPEGGPEDEGHRSERREREKEGRGR